MTDLVRRLAGLYSESYPAHVTTVAAYQFWTVAFLDAQGLDEGTPEYEAQWDALNSLDAQATATGLPVEVVAEAQHIINTIVSNDWGQEQAQA